MLHSTEILEKMEKTSNHISDLENQIEAMDKEWRNRTDRLVRRDDPEYASKMEEHNRHFDAESKLYAEKKDNEILLRILKDNYRRAIFTEVLPELLEVAKKYEGKPLGPKTKEKLEAECMEKTGWYFYIVSDYGHDEMTISNGSFPKFIKYKDLDVHMDKYDKRMLEDNRLVVHPLEEYHLCNCGEYVEDPESRMEEIKESFSKAQEVMSALEKACKEFNGLVPSGINHLYQRDFRAYLI